MISITSTLTTRRRPHAAAIGTALAIGTVLATLVLGACTADWDPAPWDVDLPSADAISELRTATDCTDLVDAARPRLSRAVEAMWPDQGGGWWFSSGGDDSSGVTEDATRAAGPASTIAPTPATADSSEAASSDGGTAGSVIGTNNQEVGVDEADLVKTDGRRLVSVVNGTLRVVELDGTPAIDGSLDLTARGATDLFLRGDNALVLGTTYGGSFQVATTLTMVSLTDPSAPTVTASADLEGSLVTARDQGGRARVVVQSSSSGMEQLSMATTREDAAAVVADLDESALLPRVAVSGRVAPIGGCSDVLLATSSPVDPTRGDVYLPNGPVSTVTVLTVGDDLTDLQPVSVQGAAETVYASTEALFVTSSSWDQAGSRTDVHRFALSVEGPAAYTGSGRAPGHLLNQFSLSEREGALRLVTTLDGGGTPLPIEPGIGDTGVPIELPWPPAPPA